MQLKKNCLSNKLSYELHLFWDSFEWFCLLINNNAKYFFFSCPRCCDRGLIVVIVYYFQIWNKKEFEFLMAYEPLWVI